MKYVIQYSLSPYFQDLLKSGLDETTTFQTIKQYGGYVQHWSERFDVVIMT